MNKIFFWAIAIIIIAIPITIAEETIESQYLQNHIYNESLKTNSENNFNLPAVIAGGSAVDNATNIEVTKKIVSSGKKNSPDIELTLKMPPKPAKIDIVLAMDTSGSMVQHYQKDTNMTYMEWASDAIESIIKNYPDAMVSVVSWDDEYQEGDRISPFYEVSKNSFAIKQELKRLYLECVETDHTIYSVGLKRAIATMDNRTPSDPYNTARIIIFVTGLSEFLAEPKNAPKDLTLDEQLLNARKNRTYNTSNEFNGYQVYTVHIGIDKRFKMEYENLTKISQITRIPNQPSLPPIPVDNIENLNNAIDLILTKLKSEPVADNVEVTDTLYPYIRYEGSTNNWNIPVNYTPNNDNSATLKWSIGTMRGDETWAAIIHTRIMLSLPIDVAEDRTLIDYYVANNTPISEIRYKWMTGYNGILELPEGKINLPSG
jgi:hypothetical protein